MISLKELLDSSTNSLKKSLAIFVIFGFLIYLLVSIVQMNKRKNHTLKFISNFLINNTQLPHEESTFLNTFRGVGQSFKYTLAEESKDEVICTKYNCYAISFTPLYTQYLLHISFYLVLFTIIFFYFNLLQKYGYQIIYKEIDRFKVLLNSPKKQDRPTYMTTELDEVHKLIRKRELDLIEIHNNKELAHDMQAPIMALEIYLKSSDNHLISLVLEKLNALNAKILNTEDMSNIDQYTDVDLYVILQENREQMLLLYPNLCYTITFRQTDKNKANENFLVWAEKIEWERAFTNIIKNSVEAIDHGIAKIFAEFYHDKLIITDNGPGFDPEVIAAFGKKQITKGKKGGHGLGFTHLAKTAELSNLDVDLTNSTKMNGAGLTFSKK